MDVSNSETLTGLLDRWRAGDESAATAIYRRYEERLTRLAERRISPLLQPHVQPESIMLEVQ